MKRLPLSVLAALTLAVPAAAGGPEILLSANFDDKPVGLPIGTGGAAVGEPTSVTSTITAIVRDWPTATPSLKVNDDDLSDAGFVRFMFLEDRAVDTGTLTIQTSVWFQAFEEYSFEVQRAASPANRFLVELSFGSTGTVRYRDRDTLTYTELGSYELGRMIPLVITFDLEAELYDIELDGLLILNDEPPGLTTYQIQALRFGMPSDEDDDGEFSLEDLLVVWQGPSAVDAGTWAAIKALYR